MSLSVKDIAGALKLEIQVVERLAKYLYPNKELLSHDEALMLRDYYYKFGRVPTVEVGPYNEWKKLDRMKALMIARLEVIEEKQSACVNKLSALGGMYSATDETLPAKVVPRNNDPGVFKFPAKPAQRKETRPGLFAGLSRASIL